MSKTGKFISGLLFPADYPCVICGSEWPLNDGYLCADCARRLTRVSTCCPVCGRPQPTGEVCPQCKHRDFDRAFSPYVYNGSGKQAVLRMKFGHDLRAVHAMSAEMAAVLPDDIKPDAVVFVPATAKSLRRRGFNQAQLLARRISAILNLPLYDCLIKNEKLAVQHTLDREHRYQNAAKAFAIKPDADVNGSTLLLVDDIITTGATADACSAVLKNAGAAAVFVLTFASVPNISAQKG